MISHEKQKHIEIIGNHCNMTGIELLLLISQSAPLSKPFKSPGSISVKFQSFFLSKLNSYVLGVRIIVLNAMFNNISVISWRSVLLVEETGVPGENHRPVAIH
jgi:hypothetical protein